jgi:hypothetical protein
VPLSPSPFKSSLTELFLYFTSVLHWSIGWIRHWSVFLMSLSADHMKQIVIIERSSDTELH